MQAQEKDRQMENKPAQNIQDSFLNTARKDKSQITIYLLSGVKLTGRIRSFDKYSVVLETNNQEQPWSWQKAAILTAVRTVHRVKATAVASRRANLFLGSVPAVFNRRPGSRLVVMVRSARFL
jgi:host factor-I protein